MTIISGTKVLKSVVLKYLLLRVLRRNSVPWAEKPLNLDAPKEDTAAAAAAAAAAPHAAAPHTAAAGAGTLFTCFTRTKVQTLTQKCVPGTHQLLRRQRRRRRP